MENEIYYQLIEEDFQTVSQEVLERKLTKSELSSIKTIIEKKINWFELIEHSIYELISSKRNNEEE